MKKSLPLVLFMSFGFLLAEEAVEQTPAALPLEKSIMPRTEGSSWTFASYEYEEGVKTLVGTVIEKVVQTLQVEGQTCFKIQITFDNRSVAERLSGIKLTKEDHDFFWEYLNAAGSHHFEELDGDVVRNPGTLAEFELTLPYPVEKGHSYKAMDGEWTVLELAQSIQVPAGSFACVVYQVVYKGEDEEDWSRERLYMAPGVGLVCLEIDRWEDGKWIPDMRDELMNYNIPVSKPQGE